MEDARKERRVEGVTSRFATAWLAVDVPVRMSRVFHGFSAETRACARSEVPRNHNAFRIKKSPDNNCLVTHRVARASRHAPPNTRSQRKSLRSTKVPFRDVVD